MLAVASRDVESAVAAVRAHWRENASEEERRAAEHDAVDHDAAEITCPACGETFASGPSECPECGLGLR